MKELFEGGREETGTFILPTINPRCNRLINRILFIVWGFLRRDSEFCRLSNACNAVTHRVKV